MSKWFSCFSKACVTRETLRPVPENVTWKDTVAFVPSVDSGRVIKVHDGDTITIASYLSNVDNNIVYRFSVRLLGIDSAELKTHSFVEKEEAIHARDMLYSKVFGKIVTLKKVSIEKYGRLLADVYLDDIHINQWMIDKKLAVPYDGKTKHRPSEWEIYI
jgi:endonuclease YncB( thermonuclease family)